MSIPSEADMRKAGPMKLFGSEIAGPKLSKEEFVKDGLSEIVGNRVCAGILTSKKDFNRFRKSLENDWDLKH